MMFVHKELTLPFGSRTEKVCSSRRCMEPIAPERKATTQRKGMRYSPTSQSMVKSQARRGRIYIPAKTVQWPRFVLRLKNSLVQKYATFARPSFLRPSSICFFSNIHESCRGVMVARLMVSVFMFNFHCHEENYPYFEPATSFSMSHCSNMHHQRSFFPLPLWLEP